MLPDQKPPLGEKPANDKRDAALNGANKIFNGVLKIIRDQPGNRPNSDNPGPKPKEGKSRIQPKAKVADAG
jgi:hypothetical protein